MSNCKPFSRVISTALLLLVLLATVLAPGDVASTELAQDAPPSSIDLVPFEQVLTVAEAGPVQSDLALVSADTAMPAAVNDTWPRITWDSVRIMPLGNSITQGSTGHDSYRRTLWYMLRDHNYKYVDFVGSLTTNYSGPPSNPDFDLDHEGHWGWRADEVINGRSGRDKLSTWLQGYTPDIVLMHLGTNDVWQGQTITSTVDELKQIIDTVRDDNPYVTVLIAQLIPIADATLNSRINALNDEIPGIAAEKDRPDSRVLVVDQNSGFNAFTDTYDGVHPNFNGEQKMAQKWFDALQLLPILHHTQHEIEPRSKTVRTLLRVLSEDERAQIHERTLYVLANTGLRVDTAWGRQILKDAGAEVDENTNIVRFPRDLVEEALHSAPKEFTLGARRPGWDLSMNGGGGTGYALSDTGGRARHAVHLCPCSGDYGPTFWAVQRWRDGEWAAERRRR